MPWKDGLVQYGTTYGNRRRVAVCMACPSQSGTSGRSGPVYLRTWDVQRPSLGRKNYIHGTVWIPPALRRFILKLGLLVQTCF